MYRYGYMFLWSLQIYMQSHVMLMNAGSHSAQSATGWIAIFKLPNWSEKQRHLRRLVWEYGGGENSGGGGRATRWIRSGKGISDVGGLWKENTRWELSLREVHSVEGIEKGIDTRWGELISGCMLKGVRSRGYMMGGFMEEGHMIRRLLKEDI